MLHYVLAGIWRSRVLRSPLQLIRRNGCEKLHGQPCQPIDRNVPALVLLNDQRVTIDEEGRVLTATSYAVRVLTRTGRSAAEAGEVYRTDTGKVRDLHAWLIPSAGAAREYSKDDIVDVALVNNDVYNEARVKRIAAAR